MHEFSLALNIADIALENAVKANATKVYRIEIDVGKLSGVQVSALEFALKMSIKDTILEGTEIKINEIAGKARCTKCQTIFDINEIYYACPNCSTFENELLQGQELRVKSIEIE
jgi:hydrogenase nickel incorporation protein HypA/HybF